MNTCTMLVCVLESYEVVKRQVQYWKSLNFPEGFEIMMMDDGSKPPIKVDTNGLKCKFTLIREKENIPWEHTYKKNHLVKDVIKTDAILFVPIDHMISQSIVDLAVNLPEPENVRVYFPRQKAILDEQGNLTQDFRQLRLHGMREYCDMEQRTLKSVPAACDICLMRRRTWLLCGGYKGGRGSDVLLYRRMMAETVTYEGPTLYCWPFARISANNDLFHHLYHKAMGYH